MFTDEVLKKGILRRGTHLKQEDYKKPLNVNLAFKSSAFISNYTVFAYSLYINYK